MLDLDIAVLRPAEGFQSLPKRDDTRQHFGVVLGVYVQERDASHALRLLRARRERPRYRPAAEQRDELAAFIRSPFGAQITFTSTFHKRDYDINPRFSAFIGFVLNGYAHNDLRIFFARLRPFASHSLT